MNINEFMNQRKHVVVTESGIPHHSMIYMDGKPFPCIDVSWNNASDKMPVVTVSFYARLEVLPPGVDPTEALKREAERVAAPAPLALASNDGA